MRPSRELIRRLYRLPLLRQALILVTARRVRVSGRSMAPTLLESDYVLFDVQAYRLGGPAVGDVVLARHRLRPGVWMIKRVARIDQDGLWLLGDNEESSTDSRTLGAFSRGDVAAKAWMIYWPQGRVRRL